MLAAFHRRSSWPPRVRPQHINRFVIDLTQRLPPASTGCRPGADPAVQQARLALCIGVKNVIFNVLTMFKINVPEKM